MQLATQLGQLATDVAGQLARAQEIADSDEHGEVAGKLVSCWKPSEVELVKHRLLWSFCL